MKRTLYISIAIFTLLLSQAHAASLPGFAKPLPVDVVSKDGTFKDSATGLIWLSDALERHSNVADSRDDCLALEYAGADDWRLPTPDELMSIIDMSNKQHVKNGLNAEPRCYWTDKFYTPSGGSTHTYIATYVDFSTGKTGKKETGTFSVGSCLTRCVRTTSQ